MAPQGRQTFTVTAREVVCVALVIYCAAIFSLALWPTDDISFVEWVISVGCVLAIIGLIARMAPWLTLPGEQYAYLLTGFLGLSTLLGYEWGADDPDYIKWRVGLLLVTGIIGSYGAHLAQDRTHL